MVDAKVDKQRCSSKNRRNLQPTCNEECWSRQVTLLIYIMVDTKVDTQHWSSKFTLRTLEPTYDEDLDDHRCVSTLVSTVIYINKDTCLL